MTGDEQRTLNRYQRIRAINWSRAFRELFWVMPIPRRWLWRWLFIAEDGQTMRRVGEHCLSDLRQFCFADRSAFDPDPIIMARREGRRDVFLRIQNALNLDENQVRKLMEIDDGL